MKTEILRKLFHQLGFIYVAGFVLLPRPHFIAILTVLLVLETLLELIRLRFPAVHDRLVGVFGRTIRRHEKEQLSGVFWMMLGTLITALLVEPVPLAVAAILYLLLGDTAASLCGLFFQGPKWQGMKKRVSGSVGCFVVCLAVGFLLLNRDYEATGIWVSALVATVAELGVLRIDDNFLIPVATSVSFLICYGLQPFFF